MRRNKHYFCPAMLLVLAGFVASSCEDDDNNNGGGGGNDTTDFPEWYYTGGELGTAFVATQTAFEQPTPVVDASATMTNSFNRGTAICWWSTIRRRMPT